MTTGEDAAHEAHGMGWRESGVALVAVAAVTALAHFVLAGGFGLYEDDLFLIGSPLAQPNGAYLFEQLDRFVSWPEGRPLHGYVAAVLTIVGSRVGGIAGLWWLAWGILVANAWLFHRLLRRRLPARVALLAALFLTLAPSDTARPMMHVVYVVQSSLTFVLLASLLYGRGRPKLGCVLAVAALLTYETFFPLYVLAPVFARGERMRSRRAWLVHLATLAACLVGVLIARVLTREARVLTTLAPSALGGTLATLAGHLAVGPALSLALCVYRPLRELAHAHGAYATGVAAVTAVCGGALAQQARMIDSPVDSRRGTSLRPTPRCGVFRSADGHRRGAESVATRTLLALGGAWLLLGYVLSFTRPIGLTEGRMSTVHTAGTLGLAVIAATVLDRMLAAPKTQRARFGALAGVSLYLGLLAGPQLLVQQDYVRDWSLAARFWTRALTLLSDFGPSTQVIVERSGLSTGRFALSHHRADDRVLKHLCGFGNEWEDLNRWIEVDRGWIEGLLWSEGRVVLPDAPFFKPTPEMGPDLVLPDGEVIVLESRDGEWFRRERPLVVEGMPFELKRFDPGARGICGNGVLRPWLARAKPLATP